MAISQGSAIEAETIETGQHSTRKIMFAMALSLVLVIATMSSMNLALPEVGRGLQATTTELTWIVDAYTLALAATVLPLGALGDKFGRRTMLLIGMAIFGLAAAAAALQTDPAGVIVCRAAMGVGAAMIMPATLATITAVFPPEQRSRGVATWVGLAGAGAVIGVAAAGLMLEVWPWESIFVGSAILAVAASIVARLFAPNTKDEHHPGVDKVGAVLSALAMGALVFGLIEGGDRGWTSSVSLISFAVAAVSLAAFVWWALRVEHPLLDVRVFGNRWFTVGTIAITAQFMAQLGFIFIAMQFLQIAFEYTPLQSAMGFLPMAVIVLPMSQLTPRIIEHVGSRVVITAGLTTLAMGLLIQSRLTAESSYWAFLGGLMVSGMGMAWTATPATTAITGSLPRAKQGVASAVNDVTREVGAAIGVAVMGTFFGRSYEAAIAPTVATVPAQAHEVLLKSPAAAMEMAHQFGQRGEALIPKIREAFMIGASDGIMSLFWILIVLAVASFFVAPSRTFEMPEEHTR